MPVSSVDSVVSKVNGPILDVLDGALQIDVTNAKITGGDDRFASPVPWAGILTGSRVVAQVIVPDVIPAVFPPRLAATNVVVFLANSGNLSGIVQGIGAAQGTFTLLYTSVKTNAATEWSGTKADGTPVKGLSDLSAGMQASRRRHGRRERRHREERLRVRASDDADRGVPRQGRGRGRDPVDDRRQESCR